jgi:hypothetical protein
MTNIRTIEGDGKRQHDLSDEMAERLKDVIRSYNGRVPLALAVGVLHIVAMEVVRDNQD